jgi:hypothetical protein
MPAMPPNGTQARSRSSRAKLSKGSNGRRRPSMTNNNFRARSSSGNGEPSPSTRAQLNGRSHVAWIEMPPGGWADGEYEDPGSPATMPLSWR